MDLSLANDSERTDWICSEYDRSLLTAVLFGIYGTMCVIGVVGNLFSFVVFTAMRHRGSGIFYLRALAIADGIASLSSTLSKLNYYLQLYGYVDGDWSREIARKYAGIDYVVMVSRYTSQSVTLAVTVDRYIAVIFPLKAPRYCTVHRAKLVTCSLFLFAGVHTLPQYFVVKMIETASCGDRDRVVLKFTIADYGPVWQSFLWGFFFTVDSILTKTLPFSLAMLLNIHVVFTILAANLKRKDLSKGKTNRNTVNIALVVVSLCFVSFLEGTYEVIANKQYGSIDYFYFFFAFLMFEMFNVSVNLFIYAFIRRGFLQTLVWCLTLGLFGRKF
ncbi:FMRFamide receptor-like [Tubulanus polymorphus]|uniref:FMRFamide receptor-like n=1 Tax=Tubulanus polymorphus TaxID=672921 RepID=UPI003DA4FF99